VVSRSAVAPSCRRRCTGCTSIGGGRGNPGVTFRGALTDYDTAETLWRPGALPEAYPIHALRARVWLRQGRTGEAAAWAREHGAVATALPDFPSGFVALTWATDLRCHDTGG
jgi:hypothetical protein